jgi:hypothetical protein
VILAQATVVFLKRQIEHLLKTIFNAPIAAHHAPKGLSQRAHDVVAALLAYMIANPTFHFDRPMLRNPGNACLELRLAMQPGSEIVQYGHSSNCLLGHRGPLRRWK